MLIFIVFSLALADLPVHCTFKQILGDWTFTLSQDTFSAYLDDSLTYCGHGQPDHILDLKSSFYFPNSYDHTVTLQEPNIAISSSLGRGSWTMIYDEGFMLDFNDISFFTYSLYVKNSFGKYDSVCDKTTIG